MITADTITDEQILALREGCFETRDDGQVYFRDESHYQISLHCNVATNGLFGAARVREARARCAEILNERAKAVSK